MQFNKIGIVFLSLIFLSFSVFAVGGGICIDNTRPVIQSFNVTPNPFVMGEPISLDATVTDNACGLPSTVSTVWATISYFDGESTVNLGPYLLTYLGEGQFSTTVTPDEGWPMDVTYNVQLDANDLAGNLAIPNTEHTEIALVPADDTPPLIEDIVPNGGYQRGTIVAGATITDEESGVDEETTSVEFFCGDNESSFSFPLTQQPESNFFSAEVDTTAFPDGTCTVRVNASDNTGNDTFSETETTIDNTGPNILGVSANPLPFIRGQDIVLDANVTDNLSGVNSVWATITNVQTDEECESECSPIETVLAVVFLPYTGNGLLYHGSVPTNGEWPTDGTYEISFDANDNAGNLSEPSELTTFTEISLFPDYRLNLTLFPNTITAGDSFIAGVHVTDDLGNPVVEQGVLITGSTIFADTMVFTNSNGDANFPTSASTTGTHLIAADFNGSGSGLPYHDSETLTVNAVPTTPPSGGGGGGGGGGGSGVGPTTAGNLNTITVQDSSVALGETVVFEIECQSPSGCRVEVNGEVIATLSSQTNTTQTVSWNPTETGSFTAELIRVATGAVLDDTSVTVSEAEATPNTNEGSNGDGTNGTEETNTPEENSTPEDTTNNGTNETDTGNNGPTGFFGLGDNSTLIGGLLGVLLLLGIGYYFMNKGK